MIVDVNYEKNKNLVAISLVNSLLSSHEKPVFLCVGTDKVICDAVGAITGELLIKKHHIDAFVYGSLDDVVDGNNLVNVVSSIKAKHPNSPIVLIDGILGELDEVGQVKFYPHGALASGQFNKGVYVGDYSILAVVNARGIDSLNLIRSVKLKTILSQAEFIAESIARSFKFAVGLV